MRTVDRWASARSRGQAWRHAVAWALLGSALLAVASGLTVAVPERVATERAFLAARPCDSDRAAPDTANCLRTIRGTVLSAENAKSGKATVFRVRLRPPVPAPADQALDLDAHGDLSELVKPGEEVEVTAWRNVQVSVSHDGVHETLPGLPDEDATVVVGFALVCAWSAALAFIAAFGAVRRAHRAARGRPVVPRVPFGVAKCVGVVVPPFVVALCAGRIWDTWTAVVMTVIVSALIAVPVTILALRWDREPSPAPLPDQRPGAELSRSD
ncbi:hypothetical protein OG788_03560 [Streptomyces sp. NBC_00647]|uniref:hypothetical protein n=1 Tax=Streptomyces sp. NBC_00647 TaxID=2975796 RepID=UPI003254C8E6